MVLAMARYPELFTRVFVNDTTGNVNWIYVNNNVTMVMDWITVNDYVTLGKAMVTFDNT